MLPLPPDRSPEGIVSTCGLALNVFSGYSRIPFGPKWLYLEKITKNMTLESSVESSVDLWRVSKVLQAGADLGGDRYRAGRILVSLGDIIIFSGNLNIFKKTDIFVEIKKFQDEIWKCWWRNPIEKFYRLAQTWAEAGRGAGRILRCLGLTRGGSWTLHWCHNHRQHYWPPPATLLFRLMLLLITNDATGCYILLNTFIH